LDWSETSRSKVIAIYPYLKLLPISVGISPGLEVYAPKLTSPTG